LAVRVAGTVAPVEAEDEGVLEPGAGEDVDGEVVGCGHAASATPPSAASTPHTVTGTVAPEPGLPGVPMDVVPELVPVHVPSAVPCKAAATAQTVTGAKTGTGPVDVVESCVGSHELLAVPDTATTTLHAVTGMTPSTGALWLPLLVGRPLTSGNPASGMHMPFDEPCTSTTAPQAVTGTNRSAA
jgi:hypothetical protein